MQNQSPMLSSKHACSDMSQSAVRLAVEPPAALYRTCSNIGFLGRRVHSRLQCASKILQHHAIAVVIVDNAWWHGHEQDAANVQ